MDAFFYWKDYAADIKAPHFGRLRSKRERLAELQAGYPNYIWAFRTPKGRKGQLQLLARLVWSDKALVKFSPAPGDSHIYYDASHRDSVWFVDSGSESAINAVSAWIAKYFPAVVASNFQGINGQHAMRGDVLADLVAVSKSLDIRPFIGAVPTEA
jgi:hypothetical protein